MTAKPSVQNSIDWAWTRRLVNSLLPRALWSLSPRKLRQRSYWSSQKAGDSHGFDKYLHDRPQAPFLFQEIERLAKKSDRLLDLGCNSGYYLQELKRRGYSQLAGVDISQFAIDFGKVEFDLTGVELTVGSFEDTLPTFFAENRRFDVIYSMGATIELVHPSFDIVSNIARVCDKYVVLFISEWGHGNARFYEYEFQKSNFLMIKCARPYNGVYEKGTSPSSLYSLLVFQRID